jgi:phosphoribosylglycinamide formyltransferase-1
VKQIAVLASGRGSNFQAVIDGIQEGYISGECACLITDNRHAYAIDRAEQAGISARVLDYPSFPTKKEYDQTLQKTMEECGADLFLLCGYMRLLNPATVHAFHHRIINIHPALLPSFPGLHAQRQALEYGVQVTGCTVHFVDEGMDTGPIILQRCVPVFPDDDEDSLSLRILAQEHEILVEATRLFCEDRLRVEGRRVYRSE